MPFYAVAFGNTPGIYLSWAECSAAVKGYTGAVYRKFETMEEAELFMKAPPAPRIRAKVGTVDASSDANPPDYWVYTDGSCHKNGSKNGAAGIGVYFGEGDERNISRRVEGKQTNNVAELTAILEAYAGMREDVENGGKRVVVVSDSEYAIKCVSGYGAKCAAKAWNVDIPNLELVRAVYETYLGKNVGFMHVRAHTGKEDVHSVGNEWADKLANRAIGMEECPYSGGGGGGGENGKGREKKIYLKVDYGEKEDAKKMGAKWDFSKKKWYIMENCANKREVVEKYGM